jgi:hypothetical protein
MLLLEKGVTSMRRIKLVFATLVVLVAAIAALAGPAVAEECEDVWGNLIECDGELYVPYNSDYYDYDDDDYSPFYSPFYSDYNYADYDDYVDDLEDDLDDYLDDLEDGSWDSYGWNSYDW